jgi:hypothetical protein
MPLFQDQSKLLRLHVWEAMTALAKGALCY